MSENFIVVVIGCILYSQLLARSAKMNMNYRFAQYLSTLKCYDFLVIMEAIHGIDT